MGKIASYFGLENAKPEVVRLTKIYTTLALVMQIAVVISTTFYLIFIATAIGNDNYIVGMTYVGILIIIEMTVQTLFDYPTGVIGDWLGQRVVLTTAYITYAVAYYLTSLVTKASPFTFIIVIYILMGFAGSQASGALSSWFDNNWQATMVEDKDNKQYGVFIGKLGMMGYLINILILIPGGILAAVLGRPWVFQFQSILCIVISFASLKLVRNLPETEKIRRTRPTMDEYFSLLREGFQFLFSSPYVKYLLLGTMLVNSCITVWANLILFPMYYNYLLTDVAVASFRTIVMIPLLIYSERSGVWAKRYDAKKWIPRFRFLQSAGAVFFWTFAVIMFVFPIPAPGSQMVNYYLPGTDILVLSIPIDSIIPVFLMITVFFIVGIFYELAGVLTSRVFISVIPNRVRNGVYSLFPTIVLIMSIPQIGFFGWLISIAPIQLTLILCGAISTIGCLMIRKAFQYPQPSDERVYSKELEEEKIQSEFEIDEWKGLDEMD